MTNMPLPPIVPNRNMPHSSNLLGRHLFLMRQLSGTDSIYGSDGDSPTNSLCNFTKGSVNVLMIGSGEYTTGFVHGKSSNSDKGAGVVALTMFDLRRRKKTNRLGICAVNGTKFPAIRQHFKEIIEDKYDGISTNVETYPADDVVDPTSYLSAIEQYSPGDAAIIFTPDDTHFDIAMACVERGMHVLISKPAVKTLEQHYQLYEAASRHNVLVAIEYHKRWDPIYSDARDRIKSLGNFSYIYSYMSQPKHQLKTFDAWAGKSSDISYYLNPHHIDFHEWCMDENSRPILVVAVASTGVADAMFSNNCEDTITLTVSWENLQSNQECNSSSNSTSSSGNGEKKSLGTGTAVYTSSWIAPASDVHSQQRFFYMGQKGEVTVDQAHRGYTCAADASPTGTTAATGLKSLNPLFMKYTPTDGRFTGQGGYGYRSLEAFIDTIAGIQSGRNFSSFENEMDSTLATLGETFRTTAILEAGRRSLDASSRPVKILYDNELFPWRPTSLEFAL